MIRLKRLLCCGLVELSGLSEHTETPDDELLGLIAEKHAIQKWQRDIGGFQGERDETVRARSYRTIIFTEAHTPKGTPLGYGQKFANLIQARGLGKVYEVADWGLNPNSGNKIKVWFWEIDHAAFWLWYAEQWKSNGAASRYWANLEFEARRADKMHTIKYSYQDIERSPVAQWRVR